MTAPEKIWAFPLPSNIDNLNLTTATIIAHETMQHGGAEYTRTDITQATIAAAMMGAADKVYAGLTNLLYSETCADIAVDLIMGCVPTDATDATAALDAMLAEAGKRGRDQGLEEAACVLDHFHSDDTHTTAAAIWQDEIRAMKGGE